MSELTWIILVNVLISTHFIIALLFSGGRVDVRPTDVFYYEQDPLPGDLLKELIFRFSDEGNVVTTFNGPENFFGRMSLGLLRKVVVY